MKKADLAVMASMGATGATDIMKKDFSMTQFVGYEHIKNMIQVTENVYLSTAYNITLIIDSATGQIFRPHPSKYKIRQVDDSIYLKELRKNVWHKVYNGKTLDFGNLKGIAKGYSTQGSYDYNIIVHNYTMPDGKRYRVKFRAHLLIAATEYGFDVLDAMGMYNREMVVHHMDLNKKNNSISNLRLMIRSAHIKLHAELNQSLKLAS